MSKWVKYLEYSLQSENGRKILNSRQPPRGIFAVTVLLLLIAASRILRFGGLGMNPDEVWSIWQTLGTPQQILRWTPYDWPPGYYLTLGLWRALSGQFPVILRYLDVLILVVGMSCIFRVIRRLHGIYAGLLVMPIYAAFGYGILLSVEVRGYALLFGMLPLTFWLTVRYFDYPSTKRAFLLAISIAAMVYVSTTTVITVVMLGIYTLAVYRKRIWRWWLPGMLMMILVFPEIVAKARLAVSRTAATQSLTLPPLLEGLRNLYQSYAGFDYVFWVWIIVALIATGVIVYRRPLANGKTLGLLLWALGGPISMYLLHPLLAFFSPRYAWWIMFGIANWIALGLAHLPRRGIFAMIVLFTILMFAPVPFQEYNIFADTMSPLENNFIWLKDHIVMGDVFLADPNMRCGGQEEWDYFIRNYFPMGLQFVKNPDGFRRVWYITGTAKPDPQLQQKVSNGRITERFVGPPGCMFRLYEAPPDPTGILYDNGMRFHGMDVMEGERPWSAPLVRHEGETVRLRLWWSVDQTPDLDYSVGTYIMRQDTLFGQYDGPPQIIYPERAAQETSRWKPGQYYIEERVLALQYPTPRLTYRLTMAVYFWQTGKRVETWGLDEHSLLTLQTLTVMAY